ncbi:hypothetical protein [Ruegeria profundi]|uniref:hypothetical protein n=1 Tax=Ruegeria profundi TaxID=1685378 RepID=UPI001CD38AA6|nr:hypothetical protein [Ruegeria profundi]MCA0930131.1 hypothetical protein [Ruegeria profundi]
MLRSAINAASLFLIGSLLTVAALMVAFFASPEAVRTSPPILYDSLLLDQLTQK